MHTVEEIQAMDETQKAQVKKDASRAVAKFAAQQIAIRVGVAVAVHFASQAIINRLNSKKDAETPAE